MNWDALMLKQSKELAEFYRQKIIDRQQSTEDNDAFERKWGLRYKELVSRTDRDTKALYRQMEIEKQEKSKVHDVIRESQEAALYVDKLTEGILRDPSENPREWKLLGLQGKLEIEHDPIVRERLEKHIANEKEAAEIEANKQAMKDDIMKQIESMTNDNKLKL